MEISLVENDRAFAAYALFMLAGITTVVAASVAAGIAGLPDPLGFLEHVSLSLAFRAAYKSLSGWDWSDWSLTGGRVREAVARALVGAEA
jgi:hypothetical protein